MFGISRVNRQFSNGFNKVGVRLMSSKYFILQYGYVSDMVNRRKKYREEHLRYAQKHVDNKFLIAGGAIMPHIETGVLIFRAENQQDVDLFAMRDPYVLNGLVTHYHIREWNVAVGGFDA